MPVTIALVITCMILNTAAQLLMKATMNAVGHFSFTVSNIMPIGLKMISCPFLFLGMICYVASFSLWFLVLSRMDVAIAYPLTSIAFIMTAIAAAFFFGEPLTLVRLTGILVIIAGVFLLFRT